ncbi:MAG: hypothetical protein QOD83_2806 [Solirubrobacteraceae bacterium]|jgi:hypothetical protein|nr:hypothetical protein [Solirubrobacteraceae bacterium]
MLWIAATACAVRAQAQARRSFNPLDGMAGAWCRRPELVARVAALIRTALR